MVTVKVIFFGDLRRTAGADEREVELPDASSLADVARAAGVPDAAAGLVALNGKTALPDAKISDGDEVAFFPRVAGGAA